MASHRFTLGSIALCLAGGAIAGSPLSVAQTRYLGAYVFERQVAVFRDYCAQDAGAEAALDDGVSRFRDQNPDFVVALRTRPEEREFVDSVEAFDARFDEMTDAMQGYLATEAPQTRCVEIGRQLGEMRFSAMIEEATHSASDVIDESVTVAAP